MIGAGPAGAASAYLLAKGGARVLLLERSSWPRDKVCGGCLSASAVACLREIGLARVLDVATPVARSHLHHGRSTVIVPVKDSFAISRRILDPLLVDAFRAVGGTFLSQASASLLPADVSDRMRWLRVTCGVETTALRSKVVLACDGLGGTSLATEPWAGWSIARDAYIGVATTLNGHELPIESGAIHMHIGCGGYVGTVRNADGSIHVAAAVDARRCRKYGGPAVLIESILDSCGVDVRLDPARLRGSPTLTRRRERIGGHRVLAVGDACGYVEPFTGEGIAWALRSAIEAATLLEGEWFNSMPQRWREMHDVALRRKQSICRAVRFAVRRPLLAGAALGVLRHVPRLSTLLTRAGEVVA